MLRQSIFTCYLLKAETKLTFTVKMIENNAMTKTNKPILCKKKKKAQNNKSKTKQLFLGCMHFK